jgi:hypothetical protein
MLMRSKKTKPKLIVKFDGVHRPKGTAYYLADNPSHF